MQDSDPQVVITVALLSGTPTRIPFTERPRRCPHDPQCPSADAPDRDAARCVALHPEQGWDLLCNGVVVFQDTGELLPDGRVIPPLSLMDVPAGV
jgi:hypothetical protein